MFYGISYKGSKSKICNLLCKIFPKATNFYDLFGGGFSVTHFMLENRQNDYENFHFNEIDSKLCSLIKKAIKGEYNYDRFTPEWVSKKQFDKVKHSDFYTKLIWSFGGGCYSFLYSKELESNRKSLHNAVVFNKFDKFAKHFLKIEQFPKELDITQRRFYLSKIVRDLAKSDAIYNKFIQVHQLSRLERMQKLSNLDIKDNLTFSSKSYENVEIKPDSIIYCDIPYKNTTGYERKFNYKKFLDWADSQENPVFISEYNIDDPRFRIVLKMKKQGTFSSEKNSEYEEERVYGNKAAINKLFYKK